MKTYIFSSFSFIRLLRIKTSSFFFNRDYCAETMFLNFWRSFTGIPVYFAVDSYYFKPSIFFKAFYVYVSYFSLFLPLLFGKPSGAIDDASLTSGVCSLFLFCAFAFLFFGGVFYFFDFGGTLSVSISSN